MWIDQITALRENKAPASIIVMMNNHHEHHDPIHRNEQLFRHSPAPEASPRPGSGGGHRHHHQSTESTLPKRPTISTTATKAPIPDSITATVYYTSTPESSRDRKLLLVGLSLNLLAQLLFGIEPAMTHVLQNDRHVGALSLIATLHTIALLIYTPRLLWRTATWFMRAKGITSQTHAVGDAAAVGDEIDDIVVDGGGGDEIGKCAPAAIAVPGASADGSNDRRRTVSLDIRDNRQHRPLGLPLPLFRAGWWVQRLRHRLLSNWLLYVYLMIFSVRIFGRVFATKFTAWDIVGFVALLTPFAVYIMARLLIRERLNAYTLVTIVLMTLGGALITLGRRTNTAATGERFSWIIDFRILADTTPANIAGAIIALTATLVLSMGIVVTRITGLSITERNIVSLDEKTLKRRKLIQRYTRTDYSPETLVASQLVVIAIIAALLSLIVQEDWGPLWAMGWGWWCVVVAMSASVTLGAVLLFIYTTHILSASKASSTTALRLVTGIIASGLTMGQWFSSIGEVLGMVIVVLSACWFLFKQDSLQRQWARRRDIGVEVRSHDFEKGTTTTIDSVSGADDGGAVPDAVMSEA